MTFIKTSILSLIATTIKLFTALVINKAIAVFIGPAGLAMIGQFQNFTQLVLTVAQGGINGGVTKYTAEYGKHNKLIPILFSTAIKINVITSIFVGVGVILLSEVASLHLFDSEEYGHIFIIFGITIPLFVLNNLILSILNGLKDIKQFIVINIIQSVYSLIFTTLFIIIMGLEGALIALVTSQSVVFLIAIWMLRHHKVIRLDKFKDSFSRGVAKKLFSYSVMLITSAVMAPTTHLIIRSHIGDSIGWNEAGYWQAIWYISTMYLMVITTTLSIYYLPRLSEIIEKKEIKKELKYIGRRVIPTAILMASLVYFTKEYTVEILFTKEFQPMLGLFLFQLIGDIFKISAWLQSYLMLAKAMKKMWITTEVVFSLNFVVMSIQLIDLFGLIGVTYAFAINNLLYFIVMRYYMNKWMNS